MNYLAAVVQATEPFIFYSLLLSLLVLPVTIAALAWHVKRGTMPLTVFALLAESAQYRAITIFGLAVEVLITWLYMSVGTPRLVYVMFAFLGTSLVWMFAALPLLARHARRSSWSQIIA